MIHQRSTALEVGTVSKNILLESFYFVNRFHGASLTLSSDVDQATFVPGLTSLF